MNEDKFTDYYRKVRKVKVLNYNTAIFPTYVVQFYKGIHFWKEYQSFYFNRNPYFAKCKSYYNGEFQILTCKRYEILTDLKYEAPDNVNRVLERCIELKWKFHSEEEIPKVQREIIGLAECIYLRNALMDVFMFSGNDKLLSYYDFSLNNVLWDCELKNYILWDVVLT